MKHILTIIGGCLVPATDYCHNNLWSSLQVQIHIVSEEAKPLDMSVLPTVTQVFNLGIPAFSATPMTQTWAFHSTLFWRPWFFSCSSLNLTASQTSSKSIKKLRLLSKYLFNSANRWGLLYHRLLWCPHHILAGLQYQEAGVWGQRMTEVVREPFLSRDYTT